MKNKPTLRRLTALLAVLALAFTGCGAKKTDKNPTATEKKGSFVIADFRDASFDETQAQDFGNIQADFSGLSRGYIAVCAESDKRMKFQILCGENKYNYDLSDGEETVFPLNMGDGSYTFRLMEQVSGTKYACSWSQSADVSMEDEFQPYLRTSQIVPYTESSDCVRLAKELASSCDSDADMASAVYDYLVKNVKYDNKKAKTVQSGYLPVPDETLKTGKGICFDYAALAAAMLRSVGIPCRLITGYVDEETYHAWNSFYLKNQGWVTVEIKAQPKSWQRVDITFAAGGTSAEKLLNDERYTTRFVY